VAVQQDAQEFFCVLIANQEEKMQNSEPELAYEFQGFFRKEVQTVIRCVNVDFSIARRDVFTIYVWTYDEQGNKPAMWPISLQQNVRMNVNCRLYFQVINNVTSEALLSSRAVSGADHPQRLYGQFREHNSRATKFKSA
jgi:hypothetical protein